MFFKKALPHILAVLTFLVLSCIFFIPQLEGKILLQSRGTMEEAATHHLDRYHSETGKWPKWSDAMFGGMPATIYYKGNRSNVLRYVEALTRLFIGGPIGYFFGGMIGLYILFMVMRIEPLAAVAGAAGFVLSTGNFVMIEEGQEAMLRSLFTMAPVIAGMLLVWRKKYLVGGIVLSAALGINYWTDNLKFSSLLTLLILVYVLFELVQAFRKGRLDHFVKGAGTTVAAIILALATVAGMIMPRMQFIGESVGGEPILESNETEWTQIGKVEGLPWEEVTRWSNGGLDLFAVMIPRMAGGSASEELGEDSRLWQDFRSRGVRIGDDFKVPLYFGDLPATNGPLYMGVAMLLLCFVGFFVVKGLFKWWVAVGMLLTALLSMGANFEPLSRLFYNAFPYYDIITHPSDFLSITILLGAILGTLALSEIMRGKVKPRKAFIGIAAGGGVLAIASAAIWLGAPQLSDFIGVNDSMFANMGYNLDALKDDRLAGMQDDAGRALVAVLLGSFILALYAWKKITGVVMAALYTVLILLDVSTINARYIKADDFIGVSAYRQVFKADEHDIELGNDNALHYRIHDVTVDAWASSQRSYRHNTIGGYQPLKLQRYHDIMDHFLYEGDARVLNMLNTRYFITTTNDGKTRLQRNFRALGNAWFVEGIRIVDTDDEEIELMKTVDLGAMAVVNREFAQYVEGFDPSRNGSIELVEYAPDRLVYKSQSQSDQLAVFSEIWYGPDKGWKIYIDGEPATLIRANYLLRAVNVPEGEHTIEMVYKPVVVTAGHAISWTVSSLVTLALLWVVFDYFSKLDWKAKPAKTVKKRKA